jgi:hypothetical protein
MLSGIGGEIADVQRRLDCPPAPHMDLRRASSYLVDTTVRVRLFTQTASSLPRLQSIIGRCTRNRHLQRSKDDQNKCSICNSAPGVGQRIGLTNTADRTQHAIVSHHLQCAHVGFLSISPLSNTVRSFSRYWIRRLQSQLFPADQDAPRRLAERRMSRIAASRVFAHGGANTRIHACSRSTVAHGAPYRGRRSLN